MKRTAWHTPLILTAIVVTALFVGGCTVWSGLINTMLPSDSRPHSIDFPVQALTQPQFDHLADSLTLARPNTFKHIDRFRKAGILAYEGPATCLECHEDIMVEDAKTGEVEEVDLMDNLTTSAHYRFYTNAHPNVWGFNGKLADNFPMGKIDRPCPKPGSFAFTAWAQIVVNKHGDTLSEGCGQCHIGSQYQPPLGELMPGYSTMGREKDAIDCLICHSRGYDMNRKQVVLDEYGARWDQDRSMKAALTVTNTTSQTCLRCHQHNFGGDIIVDAADSSYSEWILNRGHERPRVAHPGSKRGTSFSPSYDVHAAKGINCTDCHETQGHYIAKGLHTTTMMANDLPEVPVTCEKCHTAQAHRKNPQIAEFLNNHQEKVACQTCHVPHLNSDNNTMRDFGKTVYEEEAGVYIYDDVLKESLPGKGIVYKWWDGDATFLGNPIGDNPNGKDLYRFYKPEHIWPEFKNFDYAGWYEKVMRPISKRKPSKLYAMKLFNGRQHIDLGNMGPFGGMFVPYNLPTYYTTGDPNKAASVEMDKSMMKMMYGWMFDWYLMDDFIAYMDVDNWDTGTYDDVKAGRNVEPRWIPADASMEIDHGIQLKGALTCGDCHSPNGILDWKDLGYTESEAAALSQNPLK